MIVSSRGSSPCADDGPPLDLIHSGESDGEVDSKKTARSTGSPVAADYGPSNEKAKKNTQNHGPYHSLFDLEDEDV